MLKRLALILMAMVLCVSCTAAFAADEPYSFEPMLAPEMEILDTAGSAIKTSDSRAMSAAIIMFDFCVYQLQNDMELDTRALWNDCLIGRSENLIALAYDLDDGNILLVVYDTLRGEITANFMAAAMSSVEIAFGNEGYTFYTVDGDEWTDYFQTILNVLAEE